MLLLASGQIKLGPRFFVETFIYFFSRERLSLIENDNKSMYATTDTSSRHLEFESDFQRAGILGAGAVKEKKFFFFFPQLPWSTWELLYTHRSYPTVIKTVSNDLFFFRSKAEELLLETPGRGLSNERKLTKIPSASIISPLGSPPLRIPA